MTIDADVACAGRVIAAIPRTRDGVPGSMAKRFAFGISGIVRALPRLGLESIASSLISAWLRLLGCGS